MSIQMETRTVAVALAGETRNIEIERLSPAHCWHTKTPIVVKFPSNGKLHTMHHPQVFEKPTGYAFGSTVSFRNRNTARPVQWADKLAGNSGWTPNALK